MATRHITLKRRSLPLFAGLLTLLLSSTVEADRVGRLIRILTTDSSYKVRLQAVIGLGRLKDKRSVPALIRVGLRDEAYAVRALAATALGRIGDKRAVGPLKQTLSREKHAFVKTQIKNALKSLQKSAAIPSGVRFYITVGKMSNQSKKGGKALSQALASALLKEFGKVSGVTTTWTNGRKPKPAELKKRRVKAFVLDGTVLSAQGRPSGGYIEVSCTIKVSLATYPQNSMKAFYSGSAAMNVSPGEFSPRNQVSLFKEVIAGAAQGARKQIVSSYLSAQ